jgi:hypothetical protein
MRQGRLSLLTGAGGIMGRLTLPSIAQYEYGACALLSSAALLHLRYGGRIKTYSESGYEYVCNPWMQGVRNLQGRRILAP